MKHIFIIILLWPLINFSQMPDTCFTENEIIEISETLDSLYYFFNKASVAMIIP